MNTMITAIYENGVQRPLRPLLLPEHTQVRVQMEPVAPPAAAEHRQRVREALVAAGLSLPTPRAEESAVLTAKRRAELA
jgi:predicted DNA-binding antitoxin AbrB/MazE fold protein